MCHTEPQKVLELGTILRTLQGSKKIGFYLTLFFLPSKNGSRLLESDTFQALCLLLLISSTSNDLFLSLIRISILNYLFLSLFYT